MEPATLPLFPLSTVLFPGGPLPLRIFEARYLDMVRRGLKDQTPFGVVLILTGAESDTDPKVADIGTSARVVDFDTLPDGLLGITCIGERRFRVMRRWQQSDGLNLGDVEYLPQDAHCTLPAELLHLGELLREVLPKLGGAYMYVDGRYEEAGWVGNRWAEILPLSMPERLELLRLDDPLARLKQVAAWSGRKTPAAGL
jgi:Lon protease-like protein